MYQITNHHEQHESLWNVPSNCHAMNIASQSRNQFIISIVSQFVPSLVASQHARIEGKECLPI